MVKEYMKKTVKEKITPEKWPGIGVSCPDKCCRTHDGCCCKKNNKIVIEI